METEVLEGKVKMMDAVKSIENRGDLYECKTVDGQEIWTYLRPVKAKEKLTEAQHKFITNLIQGFDISTVSKEDATLIIECLSKFQNSYAPCGKHRDVDIGRAYVMGDMDWCLHNCIYYSCKEWCEFDE